ncbi:MAG: hypothetical protein IJO70_00020 [Lachnospiraceae bacterium]|nr:hypothetical protein [Lachnospiraceae bacterium]
MKRKKKEKFISGAIYLSFCAVAGGFGGYAVGKLVPKEAPDWKMFLGVFLVMLVFFAVVVIHIFFHELGHMVCGLLSGYKFNSIRFFGLMIINENGKLAIRKMTVAGTGGQCSMVPPRTDGTSPVALFNWGGCIANIITSMVAILVAIICRDMVVFSTILLIFGVVGIGLAIINGIPFKSLGNDGYNAMTLKDRPQARMAFEKSLVIMKELGDGKRLRDLPEEYFDYEVGKYELEDNLLISTAAMTLNYHIDCGNYDKVYELSKYLYENVELTDAHKLIAVAELVTSTLITGRDKSEVDKVITKENKKLIKMFEALPSVYRVWYVYELLYNGDKEKADKHKENFEKKTKNYPYKSDLQNDIELMEAALKKYEVFVA